VAEEGVRIADRHDGGHDFQLQAACGLAIAAEVRRVAGGQVVPAHELVVGDDHAVVTLGGKALQVGDRGGHLGVDQKVGRLVDPAF